MFSFGFLAAIVLNVQSQQFVNLKMNNMDYVDNTTRQRARMWMCCVRVPAD